MEKEVTEETLKEREFVVTVRDKEFVFRRTTLLDEIELNKRKTRLLGEDREIADADTELCALVYATLQFVIVKSPDGFSLDDCTDISYLIEIFTEYRKGYDFFREAGAADEPAEGSST